LQVIENRENVGFGAAINQAVAASESEFVATINDDAEAHPGWLKSLVEAMEPRYEIGMCASRVVLSGGELDSAGMLLCADGSSKQRGQGARPEEYARADEALLPSGSAALYRRDMLNEIGGFDGDYFLYCEDTDVGLRARWGAWECRYVPEAWVEHRYSHSAGRASTLKAYLVERNRLFTAVKNFPAAMLMRVPFVSLSRYFWHAVYARAGRGTAGEFLAESGGVFQLAGYVWKAHWAVVWSWRALRAKRRAVKRRLTPQQFEKLVRGHSISAKRVAAL
jgi:GT2 family glycosyltransferase